MLLNLQNLFLLGNFSKQLMFCQCNSGFVESVFTKWAKKPIKCTFGFKKNLVAVGSLRCYNKYDVLLGVNLAFETQLKMHETNSNGTLKMDLSNFLSVNSGFWYQKSCKSPSLLTCKGMFQNT